MRAWISIGFISAYLTTSSAQTNHSNSSPQQSLAPLIVKNGSDHVTFLEAHAPPLDLIRAIGLQTRLPIGVVLEADDRVMTATRHNYSLKQVEAEVAIAEALRHSPYSMKVMDGVVVLAPTHLTSSERAVLGQAVHNFGPFANGSMEDLGSELNRALESKSDGTGGVISSIPGPSSEERYGFSVPDGASAVAIANRIVSLGSKGLWCFKMAPLTGSDTRRVNIQVMPYQHYTNKVPAGD